MNSYITDLDDAILESGDVLILRRVVGTVNPINLDVEVRFNGRRVRFPIDTVEGFTQDKFLLIISPTQILDAQWPGGTLPADAPYNPESWLPRRSDQVIMGGRRYYVEAVDAFNAGEGDPVVRIEMLVNGGGIG